MFSLLIADDEEIIRKGLLSLDWKSINVNVIDDVDNGLRATEVMESELIDVVLTDIRMPGLDGLELTRIIYEENLNTEVVVLSGYDDFDYARKAIRYNVTEYILKPSEPEEILKAVKNATQRISKRKDTNMRIRLLEAELGKQELIRDKNGIVLGKVKHSDISKKMLAYMVNNYQNHLTLSILSKKLNYSSIYLSKKIKKDTGFTFLELLTAIRIYNAATQLREDRLTLTQICEEVYIKDPRYFSQVFKKHYGITPSAYKKSQTLPLNKKLAYFVQSIDKDNV